MAEEKKVKVNVKSTKQELWEAYNEAVSAVKGEKIEKIDEDPIMQAIRALADSKLKLSSEIDKLSSSLLSDLNDYYSVSETVAKQKKELLFNIENQKMQLGKEIETVRAIWREEEKSFAERIKLEKEELEKARKREDEEFRYSLAQKRKKEEDVYLESVEKKKAELKAREDAIKMQEDDVVGIRKMAAEFPAELEKEVGGAIKTLEKELMAKYTQEVKDIKMSKENDGNVAVIKLANLDSIIKSQSEEIDNLKTQVASANQILKEMAVAAIDAKSNRNIVIEKSTS